MNAKVLENLHEKFPDLKIGFMEIRNIQNKPFDSKFEAEKRKFEAFVRENYTDYAERDVIMKNNQFFKKFGQQYPVKYQIKSILNGRNLPTQATVVEAMFMAEIKNMYLTAGHDLDKIEGKLETRLSKGDESYVMINGKKQDIKANDIITSDSNGIISSVLNGPDWRTKITLDTKNILFFAYFPYGETDQDIKNHFLDIVNNLQIFAGENLLRGEITIVK